MIGGDYVGMKLKPASKLVAIKDLMPGMLFIYKNKVAVKCSSSAGPAWACIVIGTGDELYDYTEDPDTFNEALVTPVIVKKHK